MAASSKDPIYRLDSVSRSYDQRMVIDSCSLEIQRGEVFAIVGPSGAGKSTLLRLLNFIEPPSKGTIEFEGAKLGSQSSPPLPLLRKVTMVFQRPMLLERSVLENVTYGLTLRGVRQPQTRAMKALEEVGLASCARQRARTLSGGEAQRVALARALVLEPDVLLMDEPTANLDPYNVNLIESIARKLNQEHGTTLVLVTHNVFQAKRLADRVAFFLDGSLIEVAEAASFFEHPVDPRTSAFVRGEMVY
jgi:tungstate transport system ATP-binding protein